MLRLDVRKLRREGWLRPGLSFSLNWTIGGNPVGSISIFTSTDSIRLLYGTKDGEQVDELLGLDLTPCHFGGVRTWFLCPRCGRRVGGLFGGRRFWCRHCHGIAYAVENEDKLSRLLRRSNKLRERIKIKAGTVHPIVFKPKHMHQRTFDRIRWQIQGIELGFWQAMGERLNLWPFRTGRNPYIGAEQREKQRCHAQEQYQLAGGGARFRPRTIETPAP